MYSVQGWGQGSEQFDCYYCYGYCYKIYKLQVDGVGFNNKVVGYGNKADVFLSGVKFECEYGVNVEFQEVEQYVFCQENIVYGCFKGFYRVENGNIWLFFQYNYLQGFDYIEGNQEQYQVGDGIVELFFDLYQFQKSGFLFKVVFDFVVFVK